MPLKKRLKKLIKPNIPVKGIEIRKSDIKTETNKVRIPKRYGLKNTSSVSLIL